VASKNKHEENISGMQRQRHGVISGMASSAAKIMWRRRNQQRNGIGSGEGGSSGVAQQHRSGGNVSVMARIVAASSAWRNRNVCDQNSGMAKRKRDIYQRKAKKKGKKEPATSAK